MNMRNLKYNLKVCEASPAGYIPAVCGKDLWKGGFWA